MLDGEPLRGRYARRRDLDDGRATGEGWGWIALLYQIFVIVGCAVREAGGAEITGRAHAAAT